MRDCDGFARIRNHPRQFLAVLFILGIQVLGLSGLGSHVGLLDSATAAVFTIDGNSGTATDGQYFSGYHITSANPGPGTTYTIAPLLPEATGLIFRAETGTISGTPAGILDATPFTITESSTTSGLQAQLYILNIVGAPTPIPNTAPPQANSIGGISPTSGFISVGSAIVISGSFPTQVTSIQIDGVPLSPGSWNQASSSITIVMPLHPLGPVSVSIFDGQSPPLPNLALTYVDVPTPTPTPTPSATPTPTPTPTPSATPTPSPSITPAPSPSPPSVTLIPSPSALAPSFNKTDINLITNNLLNDDSISCPLMQLSTQIQVGDTAAGKSAYVTATGLLPGSTVSLYIYSSPQLLGSAVVDQSGTAKIAAVLPAELPSGNHRIVAVGTDEHNTPIQALSAFQIDPQNIVVAYVPPAQVSTSVAADQSAIYRALQAGKPLYDINLHPGAVASVAIAAASLIAVAGVGGLTGLSGAGQGASGGSGSDRSGSGGTKSAGHGKLASAVTKKLKGVKVDGPGIGDQSKSWNTPGALKVDALINKSIVKVGRRSALLPRVLVDGAWARAMFGSAGIILWGLGILVGVLSSVQVHYQVLPPRLPYILVIVALGILDSAAGALAWLAMASLAFVTGHLTSWSQLRTILGMFVLFSTVILLAHAIRPLRRLQDGSLMQRFDRVADYVMPPIFLAFAATSMFKALNGLSGLQLVHKSEFGALKLTVVIAFLVRMLLEDIALHWYPQRSLASQPAKLSSQTKFAAWSAVVLKLLIFLLVAAPFFGLGFYTMLAWEITGAMLVLKLYEDKLPNFPSINKWYPRGVANFLMMLIIGIFLGALIIGSHPTHDRVVGAFALMMIPGAIATLLELFGREGWKWPDNWEKRVIGAELWFVALGLVVGFLTL